MLKVVLTKDEKKDAELIEFTFKFKWEELETHTNKLTPTMCVLKSSILFFKTVHSQLQQ